MKIGNWYFLELLIYLEESFMLFSYNLMLILMNGIDFYMMKD